MLDNAASLMDITAMDKKDNKMMMAVFKALASEKRVRILSLLMQHQAWAGALSKDLRQTRAGLYRNLGILRKAGLVHGTREGQRVYYELAPDAEERCQAAITSLFTQRLQVRPRGRRGRRPARRR